MIGKERHAAGKRRETDIDRLGLLEWFRPGEHERVERLLVDLKRLGISRLRTGISWADSHTDAGVRWYEWLIPKIAGEVELLPCFTYTPPSIGIVYKTSAPPRNPRDYTDFLDEMITKFGSHFEWVELWNEPNNLNDWDWRIDPSWTLFGDMMKAAAPLVRQRGKKTALGGMAPTDENWLDLMCKRGVVHHMDAVGLHGFPGTWEFDWSDWRDLVAKVRTVLDRHDLDPEIWITEAGYSTWRHDEYRQAEQFLNLLKAPADRLYWYSAYDLHPELSHQDGFHEDERHYHFGLLRADGKEKLLFRLLEAGGIEGVKELTKTMAPASAHSGATRPGNRRESVLITGGAGFIGTNLAERLLLSGKKVVVFDNLSRLGVEINLRWLRRTYGDQVKVIVDDIRNPYAVREAVERVDAVYHLAAQVAVTTSIEDPVEDFDINIRGTLNLLEAVRRRDQPPPLLFTSTNKVYGALADIPHNGNGTRIEPVSRRIRETGISEARPLDLHSPYGCSKGAADQYVLDYTRTYDLPCAVFRMSCIYGPHQFGTEDQGWVAHFIIRTLSESPLVIYGDGKQVRDVLYVTDLVEALLLAYRQMDRLSGRAYNIGGGAGNTTSLLELLHLLKGLHGRVPSVTHEQWRTGDQLYYVSDTGRFRSATGWRPRVSFPEGVERLYQWLTETRQAGSRERTKSWKAA